MGGEGSGRKPDPINQFNAQRAGVATSGAENIEIPNFSGLRAGTRKTDNLFSANQILYANSAGNIAGSSNFTYDGTDIKSAIPHLFTGTVLDALKGFNNVRIGVNSTPRITFEFSAGGTPVFQIDNNGSYLRFFKPNTELATLDGSANFTAFGTVSGANLETGNNCSVGTDYYAQAYQGYTGTIPNTFNNINVVGGIVIGYD